MTPSAKWCPTAWLLSVVGEQVGHVSYVKVELKTKLKSCIKEVMLGKQARKHGSVNGTKPI
jgi:hypothetical protein